MEKLSPYIKRLDERGGFWGITQDRWAEVNFIETAAQQVRGNHYHKETRELFFIISGEIEIVIDNLLNGEHLEMTVTKGDVFIIEPYELHTFRTKTDAQWINMLSKPHDPQTPDFHQPDNKS